MYKYLILLVLIVLPSLLWASNSGDQSLEGVLLISLVVIVGAALLANRLTHHVGIPGVVAELGVGILIGNLVWFIDWDLIMLLREGPAISGIAHDTLGGSDLLEASTHWLGADIMQNEYGLNIINILKSHQGHSLLFTTVILNAMGFIGAIALLFHVGLENSIAGMLKNGKRTCFMASAGVIFQFVTVWLLSYYLSVIPDWKSHIFIASILTATSVGITTRIFKDYNLMQTEEAKFILGIAVVDDILSVALIAITIALLSPGSENAITEGIAIILKSFLLLGAVLLLGPKIFRVLMKWVSKESINGSKEIFALTACFLLAWMADHIGLAAIIGAFAAGLILDNGKSNESSQDKRPFSSLIEPIETFLTPIFFVLIGIQVKMELLFSNPTMLYLVIVLVASTWFIKKMIAKFSGHEFDHELIGLGMLPRGEVGLVFAAIGKQMGLINDATLGAIIVIIMSTAVIVPPLLSRHLKKQLSGH